MTFSFISTRTVENKKHGVIGSSLHYSDRVKSNLEESILEICLYIFCTFGFAYEL